MPDDGRIYCIMTIQAKHCYDININFSDNWGDSSEDNNGFVERKFSEVETTITNPKFILRTELPRYSGVQ